MEEAKRSDAARREEEVLAFWKERNIFEKSLEKDAPMGEFVFYDGPPFATGLPHTGSLLSSIIKDVVPRYKTMRGFRVRRRWGWDCHGLPIESLIEKRLGLKTKKDIERIGVAAFNEAARASVLEFEKEWEKYIERVGRWVDFKNSYKTMDNSYIESVWWALKRLWEKGLLYEGRKVLMYCPRCETPLAKAEIAMDNTYRDITEEAVTVKFKVKEPEKHGLPPNTYVLAWTTTPWTLPGNVALAVGADIEYSLMERNGEHFVAAAALAPEGALAERSFRGVELVGLAYEPLFDIPALVSEKSYKVYAADFVSTAEGTGIVHTAVMYGEDDFALGEKEGLPMVQLLTSSGAYTDAAPDFLRGVYIKNAERDIKRDLDARGLLFDRQNHTHSYPHCYRCGAPLIYNAVSSWFVNIQKIKSKMLAENERVTWVPAHLKHGRFGNIVKDAPDWTISRNRFWASPLPIWKEKGGERVMLVGSLAELREKAKGSGNAYFLMRHGEATSNVRGVYSSKRDDSNPMTDRGKEEARASAEALKKKGSVDVIIASPFERAKKTAEIVRGVLGLPEPALVFDERLSEVDYGVMDGAPRAEKRGEEEAPLTFVKAPEGGETLAAVKRRMSEALRAYEREHKGKRVLIVSHGGPLWILRTVALGLSNGESLAHKAELYPKTGELLEMPYAPLPMNENGEPDLHRPYTDDIILVDEAGREHERVPEVVDCWVESGAMPFAERHYPLSDDPTFRPERRFFGLMPRKGYPADFIAEYIAQTRTWFYYMHALGVALFSRTSFKTVLSTGTILAADGSKMSKSKGNYTDPYALMETHGADALRFHLLGSVVMQSEDLNFKDEDVRETSGRVVNMLWNCYKFYELYAEEAGAADAPESAHVLDRWILARLSSVVSETTEAMERYDTPRACRAVRAFIEDYSTWYVRRSRERAKSDDATDRRATVATQRQVLLATAKLVAPFMPFLAESVYRGVGGEKESVHLEAWLESAASRDASLIAGMARVRALVSLALEAREAARIRIRQPLAHLAVPRTVDLSDATPQSEQLLLLIRDEVNVKGVAFSDAEDIALDTELTDELREEGIVRDVLRLVQDARKVAKLKPGEHGAVSIAVSAEERPVAEKHLDTISKQTNTLISLT